MTRVKNFSKYCFKLVLMWVMLLWALTLPGQEVDMDLFLFHSATDQATTPQPKAPGHTYHTTLQKQAVQVFADAKPSSSLVSVSQPAIGYKFLPVSAFSRTVLDEVLPENILLFAEVGVLAQIISIILQPNAP